MRLLANSVLYSGAHLELFGKCAIRAILVLSSLALLSIPPNVEAQWSYTTNLDGTLTITGYIGEGGAVTIPTNINSMNVSGVGAYDMWFNTNITSLLIPGTITNFGDGAFYGCVEATNVVLGYGITSIGINMFGDCRALVDITIPESVTNIGDNAFLSCPSLTRVVIPSSVISIGESALQATGLTSVVVPELSTAWGSLRSAVALI